MRSAPWIRYAAMVVVSLCLGLFTYAWELYYDSDYAMIALIGKRISELKDLPLFVYKVGYQGMLLDGVGIALVFKCLGVSPYTMNVFEVICTLTFFGTYYALIGQTYGKRIAAWSLLFLAFSCPNLYGRLAHPSPNYAETFWLGTLQMVLYLKILNKPTRANVLAWGFVAGFAYYTYQMIVFFLLATGTHAALLGFQATPLRGGLREWLYPTRALKGGLLRRTGQVWGVLSRVALVCAVVSYTLAAAHIDPGIFRFFGFPTQWLAIAGGLWGLRHTLNLIAPHWAGRKLWQGWVGLGCCGFLIGYSPKFVHNWILGQPSSVKISVGGDLSEIAMRAGFAIIENLRFLNLTSLWPHHVALFVFAASLMTLGVSPAIRSVKRALMGKATRAEIRAISPVIFLAPWVVLGFLFSSEVRYISNSRYMLSIWLFYALALALGWEVWWRRGKARVLAVGLLSAFWVNTVLTYRAEYLATPRPHPHLAVRDWLEEHHIPGGYADYWIAYSLNFLSHERLIFEPLYSNYIPYYGPRVRTFDRLAYVDSEPPRLRPQGSRMSIDNREFELGERVRIGQFWIQVLQAVPR